MATLRGRAQRQLFATKKRVRIAPLSVGDVNAIAFTVLRHSARTLLRAALDSKAGKKAKRPDERVFANLVTSVVNHRKGSLYAALVTAIDTQGIFHPDQFAVGVARLGVVDDLKAHMDAENYGPLGDLIATRAPYFWADMISQQIVAVRKEVTSLMQRLFSKFHEAIEDDDVDEIIESVLFQQPLTMATPKVQLMQGAAALDFGGSNEQAFLSVFRSLAGTQRIGLLNPSSSLDATFESFHQHLLSNAAALQKFVPRAKFAGKAIPPSKLQRLFRDPQLTRRMKAAFLNAYDAQRHEVGLNKLYTSMRRMNVTGEVSRVARTQLNMKLSERSVNAIVSGVIGLFSSFAGDTKGQGFPIMNTIKG